VRILLVALDPSRDGFPLGLAYLTSYLRQQGHAVTLLAAERLGLTASEILDRVRAVRPDIVGTSTPTCLYPRALALFRWVKALDAAPVTVAGGPHVTALPAESVAAPELDFVVRGEGEQTLAALADCLEQGGDPRSVPGLAFRDAGETVLTAPRPPIQDLDRLPFPAWEDVPLDRYALPLLPRPRAARVQASRGCPFRCAFCSAVAVWGSRLRQRSPANVADEIAQLQRVHGVHSVEFVDSTFTVNRRWTLDLCRELRSRRLDVDWMISTRADRLDAGIVAALKDAGCRVISIGVESGDPEVLRRMRKGEDLEQIREAARLIRSAGLILRTLFILGFPGETPTSIERTRRLARELDPTHPPAYSYATPYPGSELYEIACREGQVDPRRWGDYWHASSPVRDRQAPVYLPAGLQLGDLHRARRRFIWELMLRKLTRLRSLGELEASVLRPGRWILGSWWDARRVGLRRRVRSAWRRSSGWGRRTPAPRR